ncbi:lamin tail domain-containing protein [Candidatus Woesearchaeota archaeon]|nr:lamin tail domain-containing protein [Candidatus Woesearchaeota archaeon]
MDNIIITEVLYNPVTESGGEAVELYNPTTGPIDVSGWVLATETSPTDVTLPVGAVISSGGYLLVADIGWSGSRDNMGWPEADYEETMTLTNTDAGIALSDGSSIIDAVGWGDQLNIGSGLYEGNPHSGSSEGEALVRTKNGSSYVDTGSNLNDFTAAAPDFHNSSFGSNAFSSTEITIVAVVEGSFPVINSFGILTDDDDSAEGNQINPVPKRNKTVEVESVVSHDNGNDYVDTVVLNIGSSSIGMAKQLELNSTASLYKANFSMGYYDAAGNYSITVTATDNSGFSANASAGFDYSSLIAMEIDTTNVQFSAMPSKSSEVIGDADESTAANTTIANIGNSVFDIELSATNLSSIGGIIDVGNIQYTFNGDYNNSLAGTLSYLPQIKQVGIGTASKQPLSFKLSIPTATVPGNYSGTITLIAVKP